MKSSPLVSRSASRRPGAAATASQAVKASDPAELLAMDEAIALLKTTRPTFYRWVRSGKLKGTKVGRQWRFRRGDVERFLEGREPQIDLPADIKPLLAVLRRRLSEAGGTAAPGAEVESELVEAVHLMVQAAGRMHASGLHLEPQPKGLATLRFRLDGVLSPVAEFDLRLLPALIRQWKTMAACDVRETARPQEGRVVWRPAGDEREWELRLMFLPAVLGEAMNARLQDPEPGLRPVGSLGLVEWDKQKLLHWLDSPWGLMVVTGPAGSGKTSMLYACLNHLSQQSPARQVMTVEDPVELLLPHTTQVPVKAEMGLTFAGVLRAVLKADADVIMVGEIRDLDTLNLVLQSALNGHLVLTSLHTSEAVTALQRMVDAGASPLTVAEATKLVIAQRLVRQLCPKCSIQRQPEAGVLAQAHQLAQAAGLQAAEWPEESREPAGCPACHGTGFHGRQVLAEVLEVSPRLGAALVGGLKVEDLRAIAINEGMTPLAAAGLRHAGAGRTSLGEILRTMTPIYRRIPVPA